MDKKPKKPFVAGSLVEREGAGHFADKLARWIEGDFRGTDFSDKINSLTRYRALQLIHHTNRLN